MKHGIYGYLTGIHSAVVLARKWARPLNGETNSVLYVPRNKGQYGFRSHCNDKKIRQSIRGEPLKTDCLNNSFTFGVG